MPPQDNEKETDSPSRDAARLKGMITGCLRGLLYAFVTLMFFGGQIVSLMEWLIRALKALFHS
jgi:hypothetical protein